MTLPSTSINMHDKIKRALALLEHNDEMRGEEVSLLKTLLKEVLSEAENTSPTITEEKNYRDEHLIRLSAAFDQSANTIVITDIHGNIEYANPRFYEVTGYTPGEIIGQNPRILKYEHSKIDYKDLWDTITSGKTWSGEFLNKTKEGGLYWEIGTISPVKNAEGQIINFLAIKENITQRKQAEEKLRKAKDFYLNLLEDFPVMVWQCDPKGSFNFFNQTFLRFTGRRPDQEMIVGFWENIHPKDLRVFTDSFYQSLDNQTPFIVEYRLKDRFGSYRWVLNHGKPFKDIDGRYGGFIGTCIDIHDRFTVEQRLMDSESKYRRMFEDSSLGIFKLDRKFSFVSANKAMASIFGYDNAVDFLMKINNTPADFFPNYNIEQQSMRELVKSPENRFVIEKEFRDKNGDKIHTVIHLRKVNERRHDKEFYMEGFIEDVTLKKMAEQNLLLSEQKFKALFEKSYDAILILNRYEVIDCNQKACKLFRMEKSNLLGSNYLTLGPDEQYEKKNARELLDSQIRKAMGGCAQNFDWLLYRKGSTFDAEISFARIFVHDQPMLQVIIRDVSEKRMVEKQIKQAKEDAEKARMAQSEFLSLMSHEIRTPLNAVVSLTDLLLQDKLTSDQMENLSSVKVSARHLLGLIDDILDYNKIESGNIQFEETDFDIRSLVNEVFKTLGPKAKEKKINLLCKIDRKVPKILETDTLRLKQILFNLLSNAIKFTEKGYVHLKVGLKSQTEEGNRIVFEVKDTGIGIAADRLDAIFERFTQAETSTTRKYGGSGLGLTISKKLVELQQGEIYAESTVGHGSLFTFILPMKTGVRKFPTSEDLPKIAKSEDLEGMRILMVEDDKMNQFVGTKVIEKKWKAKLTIAPSGEEALELLESNTFDLILMDLLLPEMDGYEVTRRIRSGEESKVQNHEIPIIALTADAFNETRNKAYEAGVDDFVSKPFDYDKLFEKIFRYKPS